MRRRRSCCCPASIGPVKLRSLKHSIKLLAPIALYPDALLAQILLCAQDPGQVVDLQNWMAKHTTLKGTDLQDEATASNFDPSFVALVLFPQVVDQLAR